MKALPALLACACTNAATLTTRQPTAETKEAAPQYPTWLEMKPGYAETCINGGGCIPMTHDELNQLVAQVMQRTLQACRRGRSI